jgi:hypothetical protein
MNAKDPTAFIRGLIRNELTDLEDAAEREAYQESTDFIDGPSRLEYLEEQISGVKAALHYFNRLVENEPAKAEEEQE